MHEPNLSNVNTGTLIFTLETRSRPQLPVKGSTSCTVTLGFLVVSRCTTDAVVSPLHTAGRQKLAGCCAPVRPLGTNLQPWPCSPDPSLGLASHATRRRSCPEAGSGDDLFAASSRSSWASSQDMYASARDPGQVWTKELYRGSRMLSYGSWQEVKEAVEPGAGEVVRDTRKVQPPAAAHRAASVESLPVKLAVARLHLLDWVASRSSVLHAGSGARQHFVQWGTARNGRPLAPLCVWK